MTVFTDIPVGTEEWDVPLNAALHAIDNEASSALSTANTAVTNASNAQSTANTAITNAAAAQTTANTAVTNAAAAQTTANSAITALNAQNTPMPADQNLLAWAYDPATISNNVALTAGVIQLVKIIVRNTVTVTNVMIGVATAGTTMTAGQNFAGLYNGTGTLIDTTADQSTNWTTTGLKTMALTTTHVLTPGSYYVAFVANSTGTFPAIARSNGQGGSGTIVNAGLTVATSRWLNTAGGNTSLPGTITLGSQTQQGNSFWAAIS